MDSFPCPSFQFGFSSSNGSCQKVESPSCFCFHKTTPQRRTDAGVNVGRSDADDWLSSKHGGEFTRLDRSFEMGEPRKPLCPGCPPVAPSSPSALTRLCEDPWRKKPRRCWWMDPIPVGTCLRLSPDWTHPWMSCFVLDAWKSLDAWMLHYHHHHHDFWFPISPISDASFFSFFSLSSLSSPGCAILSPQIVKTLKPNKLMPCP